jgi:hypothetical protein
MQAEMLHMLTRKPWRSNHEISVLAGVLALAMPLHTIAQAPQTQDTAPPADARVALAEEQQTEAVPADPVDQAMSADPSDAPPAEVEFETFEEVSDVEAPEESPLRVSAAYEFAYKTQGPKRTIKNRASLRLEYARTYNDHLSAQFDAKLNAFMGNDHRRLADDHDLMVTQAYLQSSFGQTSVRVGIQTLPWGESLLAPITDEISPRDNRELFNFNLEELRIGQPMATVDRYDGNTRWSAFVVPKAEFNKTPEDGTLYDFDPLTYRRGSVGDSGVEYGFSWKRNYERSDIMLMAASLVDNDYVRRRVDAVTTLRVRERFTLTGMSFTRALGNFVLRGEAAVKFDKPFNDQTLQIVRKRTIETYLGLDYRATPTLSLSAEALNQHISDWDETLLGFPRNRQTGMLSVQKNFMNDDVSITLQAFGFWPNASTLTMLLASWTVNDNITLSLNVAAPSTNSRQGSLWAVRDQKQTLFKVQWQF